MPEMGNSAINKQMYVGGVEFLSLPPFNPYQRKAKPFIRAVRGRGRPASFVSLMAERTVRENINTVSVWLKGFFFLTILIVLFNLFTMTSMQGQQTIFLIIS